MELSWSERSSFLRKHKRHKPAVLSHCLLRPWWKENIDANEKYIWNYKLQAFNPKKIFPWNELFFFFFFFIFSAQNTKISYIWKTEFLSYEWHMSFLLHTACKKHCCEMCLSFFCDYVLILPLLYLSLPPKKH